MRAGEDAILQTIERIYDAAVDPGAWESALLSLGSHYPGGQGTLVVHDPDIGNGIFAQTAGWNPEWVGAYNTHFNKINPWLANLRRRPVGKAVPAEYMHERAQLLKTEFFNDFLRPQDLLSGVGVTLAQSQSRFIAVSVLFPGVTAEAESRNVALLQRLSPHLLRAIDVNRRLEMASIRGIAVESTLDSMQMGVILATDSGRVVYFNRAADQMLRESDGVSMGRGGQLVAAANGLTPRIQQTIAGAAAGAVEQYDPSNGAFFLERPSGKPPYSVLIVPLRPSHTTFLVNESVAAIFLTESGPRSSTPAAVLSRIFGITRAEANILKRLLEGESPAEASAALQVSIHTCRTHLKNIYLKLGCSKRSEVVRLVTSHPIWNTELSTRLAGMDAS